MNTRPITLLASLITFLVASCSSPSGQPGGRGSASDSASGVTVSFQSKSPLGAEGPGLTGTPRFSLSPSDLRHDTAELLNNLARKHPQRNTFEAAVAAKIKAGAFTPVNGPLTVTYQDGTSRQFE